MEPAGENSTWYRESHRATSLRILVVLILSVFGSFMLFRCIHLMYGMPLRETEGTIGGIILEKQIWQDHPDFCLDVHYSFIGYGQDINADDRDSLGHFKTEARATQTKEWYTTHPTVKVFYDANLASKLRRWWAPLEGAWTLLPLTAFEWLVCLSFTYPWWLRFLRNRGRRNLCFAVCALVAGVGILLSFLVVGVRNSLAASWIEGTVKEARTSHQQIGTHPTANIVVIAKRTEGDGGGNGDELARCTADKGGNFKLCLPAGKYELEVMHPRSGGVLPRADSQKISVTPGNCLKVDRVCPVSCFAPAAVA